MVWSTKLDLFTSSFTPLTVTPSPSFDFDIVPMDTFEPDSLVFNTASDSAFASGTGWASASFSGFASGSGSVSVSGSASASVADDGTAAAQASGAASGDVTDVTASASAGDSFDFEAINIDTSAFTVDANVDLILIDLPDLGSLSTDVTVTTPELDLSQLDLGFGGFDGDFAF